MPRKANFQTIAWFWDLHNRRLLDLDPPYQRRSVWNQEYKDYFIDTILLGYPCPAIFLYEEINPDGTQKYSVVDGKQRLSTVFLFAQGEFPVGDEARETRLRQKYFGDFDDDTKRRFWSYAFSVEYLPSANENIINDVFDRINRNTSRLTRQELRHARFAGRFIKSSEELAEWMLRQLPQNFPNLAARSYRQMKDVELVAQLLLLLEVGPRSYSQDDLDEAFSERDAAWEGEAEITDSFRQTITLVRNVVVADDAGPSLTRGRLRNQADFYSLFGAISECEIVVDEIPEIRDRLERFVSAVEDEDYRAQDTIAKTYYQAARSASNDAGPRKNRIEIIKTVIQGGWPTDDAAAATPPAI